MRGGVRGGGCAAATIVACLAVFPARAEPSSALGPPPVNTGRICDLIAYHADLNGLPRDFFARLIWKESRFDPNAVSPAGAEGVAQFMPGTARMRGLANSFDIEQAIPASARYLAEMKASFGNLGLAAAAYNSGESRVSRWLSSGGFLPLETENYVLDIMGEPADNFSDASYAGTIRPLDPKADFASVLPAAAHHLGCDDRHGQHPHQAVGHPGRRQFPALGGDPAVAADPGPVQGAEGA